MMRKLDTEIVVISAGTAGLAASVAAAEKGASVIAFEKASQTGGTGFYAAGLFAVESRLQLLKQITFSREEAFKFHMDFTQWRADARLVKAYIDKSASTVDWLENMGVEFQDVLPHNPGYNCTWHIVKSSSYPSPQVNKGITMFDTHTLQEGDRAATMMKILTEKAKELGVQIFLETSVKKIIKKNGRITGIMAEDRDGEFIQANADAVIVATGGFGGCFPHVLPGLVGDGIRMAGEVGANVTEMTTAVGYSGLRPPRIAISHVFQQPALVVNLLGERFMNEEIMVTSPFWWNAVARQKNGTFFTMLDEDTKNIFTETGLDFVPHSLQPISRVINFDSEFKLHLERGTANMFMADSLEELANKAGIDLHGLRTTIEEYNRACETGRDEIFNKKARYLRPVKRPKFYASKRIGHAPSSWEGIKINYKTEVLTKDHAVIPGLYAAGTDAMCNIYSDIYPYNLPGNALGFAINSGRMAGENASEYIRSIHQ